MPVRHVIVTLLLFGATSASVVLLFTETTDVQPRSAMGLPVGMGLAA